MVFHPTYPIQTSRLELRPFTRGDVDAVHAYRSRADVALYLFDPPLSRDQCAQAVQQRTTQTAFVEEGDKIVLAVQLSGHGTLIGEISLIWRSEEAGQGEVGWIFHPDFQRQGYASEAAKALLALGFAGASLHRIYARCDAGNLASWRLMERLGMRREAHFREHGRFKGRWDEEYIYAMLACEWQGQVV